MFGVIVLVTVIAVTPAFMLFFLLAIYTVSGPVRWIAWKIQGKKGFQEGAARPASTRSADAGENLRRKSSLPRLEKPGENIQD